MQTVLHLAWWDDPLWGKQPTQFLIVILGLTQLGRHPLCMPFSRILATSRSPRRYHPSIRNSTILDWWRLVTFGDMWWHLVTCKVSQYVYNIYIVWYNYVKHRGWSHHGLLFYPYKSWMFFELYCSHLAIGHVPISKGDCGKWWPLQGHYEALWRSLRYRLYTFVWQVNWFLFCQNSATSTFQQTITVSFQNT